MLELGLEDEHDQPQLSFPRHENVRGSLYYH